MNNFKRILIIIIISIFLFALNISEAKSYSLNNSDTQTSKISKFIPENNELLFYSNYKNNEINKFIKKRFKKNEINKINIINDGLITYLGFDFKENLNNIYDGEFILSTFKTTNKKKEILIIFKVKKEKNLNEILNIENNDYKTNQLIEIKRPNTLNLITHVTKTNDNFIICASNKDLIYDSLKALHNDKIKEERDIKFKYYQSLVNKKRLFLYTSKDFYNFKNMSPFYSNNFNFITKFNFDNNQLVLNSFSLDNYDKKLEINNHNLKERNDLILLSNNIISYKNLLNNIVKDKVYKEVIKNISNTINNKIFVKVSADSWVIGFKTAKNNFSIDKLTSLKDFHQDQFKNDNYIYTIFSKNNLEFADKKAIYKTERPIFVYKSNDLIFLTNNLNVLLNILNTLVIDNLFEVNSSDLIVDDKVTIRKFNNEVYKDFLNIFELLNYFTVEGLTLSLDTIESQITQKIPEIIPSIQFQTYINLF
tara:strand:- start:1123 stop:2562 length:1440 start_codon:yes stop_codon:yes gene_type:complete